MRKNGTRERYKYGLSKRSVKSQSAGLRRRPTLIIGRALNVWRALLVRGPGVRATSNLFCCECKH